MVNQINKLREILLNPLPGESAQYRMAPEHRSRLSQTEVTNFRPSAVLLLLCYDEQGLYLPLIQRNSYDGAHSAQVSLPGGKFEKGDGNLEATALRECREEIGIDQVEVLGRLSPLYIPVSGFLVHPFVGVCKQHSPIFVPQQREVQEILALRARDLNGTQLIKSGWIELGPSLKIKTPWYEVQGKKVWGATAMILSEFSEIYAATL